MRVVVVGVGSNLGSREATIRAAEASLGAHPRIEVEAVSPLYETEPVGPPQPRYLNAAFRMQTDLDPEVLLEALLDTERTLGRNRSLGNRWGARALDLDLLWDSRGPVQSDALRVPHAELLHRRFAMTPMLDVAPELSAEYAPRLVAVGGPLAPWDRSSSRSIRHADRRIEVRVESDSVEDACALSVATSDRNAEQATAETRVLDSSASALANAIAQLLACGKWPRRVTLSHCSDTQWVAHFQVVKAGVPRDLDVRLQTTSGTTRAFSARLSMPTIDT